MLRTLKAEFFPVHQVAIPMILSAISIPMLGLVDTIILGHLESPVYLGAVNIGSTGLNMLLWALGFLRMSTTGLVAQAFGAQAQIQIQQHLAKAIVAALAIGFVLLLAQPVLIPAQLNILSQGGAVADLAAEYMHIRYFALPLSLFLFVINGYFLAINQAKKVLALMLTSQVTNMVLNYYFVVHMGMDVAGVAWGSLLSEALAVVLAVFWLLKSRAIKLTSWQAVWQSSRKTWLRFFKLNGDIFIRTLCLISVFTLMTRLSAQQGELVLAANAVLMNFFYLVTYGLDGYAHAVESISGRLLGKNDARALKNNFHSTLFFSMVMALLFTLSFALFGNAIIGLLTDIVQVKATAIQYLPWLASLPLLAMPSFIYDGLCIGTTQSKAMRNAMIVAVFCAFLPAAFLLTALYPDLRNHMLWLSFVLFFIVRGAAMAWFCAPFGELMPSENF